MLLLTVSADDIKLFMNQLLKENLFDNFEVRGTDIVSFTHFNISAQKISDTYVKEAADDSSDEAVLIAEKTKYCKWSEIKPYIFNIIKGNVRPKNIKIIFSLDSESALKLHDNAAAMYLNLNFNGETINFTTAVAQKRFALDKSLDAVWEEYVIAFFKENGVNYTQM
jgi:hypothetical protein